jgi:hypothetical protein
MIARRMLLILVAVTVSACGGDGSLDPVAQAPRIRLPSDPITSADLDRFLAVIEARGDSVVPEFSPPNDDDSLDHRLSGSDLASRFRRQFHNVFDVERQGAAWEEDEKWSRALDRQNVSSVEFAGLVRSISCSVMSVRLKARIDMGRLQENARTEVEEIIATMDAIDDVPPGARSKQDEFIRSQSALRLARAVALQEFAEMVRQVPEENCTLVRKYSAKLKPLLPSTDGLLSELQALGGSHAGDVIPVRHER